jgi:hypothetical protein
VRTVRLRVLKEVTTKAMWNVRHRSRDHRSRGGTGAPAGGHASHSARPLQGKARGLLASWARRDIISVSLA